ncbi:10 TM acyl transferase domain found in Cas1p-domain-containing protein [Cokeromyces recurvatus]|uniref:10 TM acyl transferase domain found in Cas1p-domain-containing protein n=2 Tax=Cokeromyces recurvatus TaxID=90255 RepID=UPI0022208423|nr:10 TM acyl transferase domain found in Cas1p-domain-containing protein [Cokeromyces recurvatus]KAI7900731.1 10 TM acyl transferase domain found in Cas1p-domain-containing protein [Cokeromyces recurvatus]
MIQGSFDKDVTVTCIITFVLIGLASLSRFIYNANDQTRCESLLNEGWWITDAYKQWQPASCMMHTYKSTEVSDCLGYSNIVYIGDSIVRQQFFAAVQLIRPNIDISGEPHVNRKYVFDKERITIEFFWDPYLNETRIDKPTGNPSLLVVGTGAWQMRYLGDDYFESWKASMNRVFNAAQSSKIADALLVSPVEIPDYVHLSPDRTATITMDKIERMNSYLKEFQSLRAKTRIGIPFVWNQVSTSARNMTVDGLHYNDAITFIQTQIALNFRCNDQVLEKTFPMDHTCCFSYPFPKWYQILFIAFFFIYLPLGFLFKHTSLEVIHPSTAFNVLFPSKKVLNAFFVFGLCVMYMYYSDRTQLFGKIQKHFSPSVFTGIMILLSVIGLFKLEHNKDGGGGGGGFLNRQQTEEWKGWMQIIILVYHFCGASSISGIYNAVRVLVAAYLFQTGYGHFFFFYKKADFGIGRVLNVMVRLNFLTFVLQYLMDTDYLSYYFTPLVSFWFFVIWITMYIGHGWNKKSIFIVAKIVIACCLTTSFIHVPGVLETVFDVFEVLMNVKWNASEWRFRLGLDAYIVYVGMLCALGFIKITEYQVLKHRYWNVIRQITLSASVLAMIGYFWYELTRENKFIYNRTHPYLSWIPILAFVFLRNGNAYLRMTYSKAFAFMGRISLETFIGQFHMWLAGDTKGLLVVLVKPTWVKGFGWWINLVISSYLFIFVCYYLSQSTHEISGWICNFMMHSNKNEERTKYQTVPLLPVKTEDNNNAEQGLDSDEFSKVEEEEEEPSQKSFITKVKLGKAKKQNRPLPHWFRMKSDTKIRWNAKRRNWRHTKLNI